MERKSERNMLILQKRAKRYSLRDIAQDFSISHCAVKSIIVNEIKRAYAERERYGMIRSIQWYQENQPLACRAIIKVENQKA